MIIKKIPTPNQTKTKTKPKNPLNRSMSMGALGEILKMAFFSGVVLDVE